ncbi:MAG: beta-ketoacyl-ACP reductase, partial [Verrucomicrobiota bacterium]
MNAAALITGSSRGIGRGIALTIAKAATHDLVINYAGNE